MQNGFFAFNDDRMTGIVSALKTGHCAGLVRQQVDDFAFALVAPLGAYDDYVFTHKMQLQAQSGKLKVQSIKIINTFLFILFTLYFLLGGLNFLLQH